MGLKASKQAILNMQVLYNGLFSMVAEVLTRLIWLDIIDVQGQEQAT